MTARVAKDISVPLHGIEEPQPAAISNRWSLSWLSSKIALVGLLVITVALPLSDVALRIGAVMMVVGTGLQFLANPARGAWSWSAVNVAGCSFGLWIAISRLHAWWIGEVTWTLVLDQWGIIAFWCLYPMAVFTSRLPMVRWWQIWALMIGGIVSSVIIILQLLVGWSPYALLGIDPSGARWGIVHGVVSGPASANILTVGFVLAVLILWLVLAEHVEVRRRWRWLAAALMFLVLILVPERSILLGLLVGFAVRVAFIPNWRQRMVFGGVLLVLTGCCAWSVSIMRPGALEAMWSGSDGRWDIWRCVLEVIRTHPVFGIGGGDLVMRKELLLASSNLHLAPCEIGSSHNAFLGLAAHYGITSLILFVVMIGTMIGPVWRARHNDGRAVWRVTVSVLVFSFIAGNFNNLPFVAVQIVTVYLALAWSVAHLSISGMQVGREQ